MTRALALGLVLLAAAPADAATRRALIVGANDGGSELEQLRYAHNDAWRFADVLTTLGGFDDKSITVLNGPTVEQLGRTLNEIGTELNNSDEETLFVFYYSGHADARGLQLYEDVYTYEDLKASIRGVDADVHLGVLDACRSGAVTRVKGAHIEAPFLQDGLDAEGEAWLAASAADEDAQESDRLQGSFFTHYLVSGMRGAADTGDGWVSLNEAYAYAYERTVSRTAGTDGGTQHPSYDFRLQGNGDLKLTDMQSGRATIVLPKDVAGEITVLRAEDGLPVAEVAKLDDRQISMALDPGTYILKRRIGSRIRSVKVHLADDSTVTVDRWGAEEEAEEGTAKGSETDEATEDAIVDEDGTEVAGPEAEAADPDVDIVYGEDPAEAEGQPKQKLIEDGDDAVIIRLPKRFPDMPDFSNWKLKPPDLKNRRGVAAGLSSVIPGVGQMYSGRWAQGLAFLTVTSSLNGGAWVNAVFNTPDAVNSGAVTGPNFLTWAGLAAYFWNVNDASYHTLRKRKPDTIWDRPGTGITVSAGTTWSNSLANPHASGIAIDGIFFPGVSFGLDRTGWVGDTTTGNGDVRTGVRVMGAVDGKHFRPGLFVAGGIAVRTGDTVGWRETAGVGANIRYYPTPRYFLEYEGRLDYDRVESFAFSNGLAFGFHIGS